MFFLPLRRSRGHRDSAFAPAARRHALPNPWRKHWDRGSATVRSPAVHRWPTPTAGRQAGRSRTTLAAAASVAIGDGPWPDLQSPVLSHIRPNWGRDCSLSLNYPFHHFAAGLRRRPGRRGGQKSPASFLVGGVAPRKLTEK